MVDAIKKYIGKKLVNFSVRNLNVRPHETDLILPIPPPVLDYRNIEPIEFRAYAQFVERENVPEEIAKHRLIKHLLTNEDFQENILIKKERVWVYELQQHATRYELSVKIIPRISDYD